MSHCVRAVSLTTKGGTRLAAGCICRKENADECLRRLNLLENYEPIARDLIGIDFELAGMICEMFGLDEDGRPYTVAAGCSVHVDGAEIPAGTTTGGILGDPCESPESSEDEAESLRDGFSIMTLSGSPGLAADTDRGTINTVLFLIKKLKTEGILNEAVLDDLFSSFGIKIALLVFDGTGDGAEVFMAAKDEDGTRIYT